MKFGQRLAPSFCTGGQGRCQEAMGEGLGGESIWQSRSQQGGIRTIVKATQRAGKHEMVLGWKRFHWGSSSTYLICLFPTQSWSRDRQWTRNPPASGPELCSNKALLLGLQLFPGS